MLKKYALFLLSFLLITGCTPTKPDDTSMQEQSILPEKAYEMFDTGYQSFLNKDEKYIHNITTINMGNPEANPDSYMFMKIDFTGDTYFENDKQTTDINIIRTNGATNTEISGKLIDDTFIYNIAGEEFSENTDFNTLSDSNLVYNIDFLPKYIQNATLTEFSQNYKQVNITIDNTSGKEFLKTCIPQIENAIDLEGDMSFDNIYIEYIVDDNNNIVDLTFNIQLMFLNGENKIPYSVNISRSFVK